MIPYILTEQSLTVVVNGKALTMAGDHPNWEAAKQALSDNDPDQIETLFDVAKSVEDYFDQEAAIEVKDGAVRYEGEEVHNLVVDKILNFMREGLPYKPLVKFLGKLLENPSRRAIDELYSFLEHKSMPITEDGNFIAYKGVTSDFKDFYSRKFDNSVGQTLEMRRNGVCDDANHGCSAGFHAGSYEYASGYASSGGHMMRVEIDPADVVSVPHDCECQKLRTSKYKVVALHETVEGRIDEPLEGEYYSDEENEAYSEGYQAGLDARGNSFANN
jgi:hypothetical protein